MRVARAERATEIGLRFGDPDLVAMGIHLHGIALIDAGRVAEGMALLDEAMTSVVAGELGTFFTGVVYCAVIAACLEVSDVGRLGEWNEAARQWCESLPADAPFPAICRVNRAEAASLRGAWPGGGGGGHRVTREMRFNPRVAARAFYETGEIRRRVGNLAGAEEAFARAHELGFQPQPGWPAPPGPGQAGRRPGQRCARPSPTSRPAGRGAPGSWPPRWRRRSPPATWTPPGRPELDEMAGRLGARAGRVGGDRGRGAAAGRGRPAGRPGEPARRLRDLAGAAAPV